MKNIGLIITAAIFGVLILFGVWAVNSYISAADFGNSAESALKVKYENLGNVMTSGQQQISGVAQAAGMAKDDLKEVFTAAIAAREGADGSKAIYKMVKEHNPNVDPSLYREIQRVVQATRKELQATNSAFLTQRGLYEQSLGTVVQGFWLKQAGYPKVDLSAMRITVLGSVKEAQRTGIEQEIKLR